MAFEHPRKVLIALGLISFRERCYDTARENLFERLAECEELSGKDREVCENRAFADYEAATEKCMGIKIPIDPPWSED